MSILTEYRTDVSIKAFIEIFKDIRDTSGLVGDDLSMFIRDYMIPYKARVSWDGDMILIAPFRKMDQISIYLQENPWSHVIINMITMMIVSYGPIYPLCNSQALTHNSTKIMKKFDHIHELYDGVVVILRHSHDNIWKISTMESIEADTVWFNSITRGKALKDCFELYPKTFSKFEFIEDGDKTVIKSDSLDKTYCYHLIITHPSYNLSSSKRRVIFLSAADLRTGGVIRDNKLFPGLPVQFKFSNYMLESLTQKKIYMITIADLKKSFKELGPEFMGMILRGKYGDVVIKSPYALDMDDTIYDLTIVKSTPFEYHQYSLLRDINPHNYLNYAVFRCWCIHKKTPILIRLFPDIAQDMFPEFNDFLDVLINVIIYPKRRHNVSKNFRECIKNLLLKYENNAVFNNNIKTRKTDRVTGQLLNMYNTKVLYDALEEYRIMNQSTDDFDNENSVDSENSVIRSGLARLSI